MDEFFRYKRRNRAIYTWREKIYIPVTLTIKNQFARVARENRMSQAEFGALIVMHYLSNSELSVGAVIAYRAAEARFQQELLERRRRIQSVERFDGEEADFEGEFENE